MSFTKEIIRQRFEKWFSEDGKWERAIERSVANPDGYSLQTANTAWEGWKAAYASMEESEKQCQT